MDHIRRWLYETNLTIGVHFKKYLHSYQYFWPNPNPLNMIVDKNDEYWPNIEHTAKLLGTSTKPIGPSDEIIDHDSPQTINWHVNCLDLLKRGDALR